MYSFSQGQATDLESLNEGVHSELIYVFNTPQDIPRKILSLGCVMSDTSLSLMHCYEGMRSVAWYERAINDRPWSVNFTECHSQLGLRAIGWGSCGFIYEQHGTSHVWKRAINNGGLEKNCRLGNNFIMHRTVEEAFARSVEQGGHLSKIHVPRCSGYISKDDKRWWAVHERLFRRIAVVQRTCCARNAFLLFISLLGMPSLTSIAQRD